MPRSSGGAHYLRGLEGEVTCVLHHGVIVALDNDPALMQRVVEPGGRTGPKVPRAQRQFQFNELIKLDP